MSGGLEALALIGHNAEFLGKSESGSVGRMKQYQDNSFLKDKYVNKNNALGNLNNNTHGGYQKEFQKYFEFLRSYGSLATTSDIKEKIKKKIENKGLKNKVENTITSIDVLDYMYHNDFDKLLERIFGNNSNDCRDAFRDIIKDTESEINELKEKQAIEIKDRWEKYSKCKEKDENFDNKSLTKKYKDKRYIDEPTNLYDNLYRDCSVYYNKGVKGKELEKDVYDNLIPALKVSYDRGLYDGGKKGVLMGKKAYVQLSKESKQSYNSGLCLCYYQRGKEGSVEISGWNYLDGVIIAQYIEGLTKSKYGRIDYGINRKLKFNEVKKLVEERIQKRLATKQLLKKTKA